MRQSQIEMHNQTMGGDTRRLDRPGSQDFDARHQYTSGCDLKSCDDEYSKHESDQEQQYEQITEELSEHNQTGTE